MVRSPGTGIEDSCEPPCGCWDVNLGPLQEHQVVLTIEPSFQPLYFPLETWGKAEEMQVRHEHRVRKSLRSFLLEPSQGRPVNFYSANGYENTLKNRKGSANLNINPFSSQHLLGKRYSRCFFLKIKKKNEFFILRWVCSHACLRTWCLWYSEEGFWPPGTGVIDGCELACAGTPNSLQEQQVILTVQPSL